MAQIRARAWLSSADYPERSLPELMAKPNVGLCLSGGGTRATCAAMGYMRGLLELGLLERFRYISAVSGGSWALLPYSYYSSGASSDAELLGDILEPQQLDRATLRAELPSSYLGHCAAQSFRDNLFDTIRSEGPGLAWVRAAGETFLQPWGLAGPGAARSFSWSGATRDAIVARNAELPGYAEGGVGPEEFALVRPGRPYPIVSASLLGPEPFHELARLDPVGFEFTPLYAGVRHEREVSYAYEALGEMRRRVGGGLVEPLGIGGAGPGWMDDRAEQELTLELPWKPTDLSFVAGSSSCAYASVMAAGVPTPTGLIGRVPWLFYWAPRAGNLETARPFEFGDGGVIDNFGIYALLQREVETIVVLVNTKQPLSVDWNAGEGSYQPHIDPYIPPMFGVHEPRNAIALHRNQVFETEEFGALVNTLQAAKLDERPVIAVREHRTVDNPWWGIRGGRKVRVCWVYLDRTPAFEAALPQATQAALALGRGKLRGGPFVDFPNYKTIGANRLSLVRFTPEQIRLLANYCSWVVLQERELFESLLR